MRTRSILCISTPWLAALPVLATLISPATSIAAATTPRPAFVVLVGPGIDSAATDRTLLRCFVDRMREQNPGSTVQLIEDFSISEIEHVSRALRRDKSGPIHWWVTAHGTYYSGTYRIRLKKDGEEVRARGDVLARAMGKAPSYVYLNTCYAGGAFVSGDFRGAQGIFGASPSHEPLSTFNDYLKAVCSKQIRVPLSPGEAHEQWQRLKINKKTWVAKTGHVIGVTSTRDDPEFQNRQKESDLMQITRLNDQAPLDPKAPPFVPAYESSRSDPASWNLDLLENRGF